MANMVMICNYVTKYYIAVIVLRSKYMITCSWISDYYSGTAEMDIGLVILYSGHNMKNMQSKNNLNKVDQYYGE